MKILSIETSCDETAIALIEANGGFSAPKFKVLKNLVSSQIKIHRPFGGVVPGLAKREHLKNLPMLYRQIFSKGRMTNGKSKKTNKRLAISDKPDIIAVTVGPGLEPALWTGINFAQELHERQEARGKGQVKIVGVNHLEGHLYSFLLSSKNLQPASCRLSQVFPAVVLLVSGGHTAILLMKDLKTWKRLGETRDDAAGEAFDKVARMLRLPYPGGPEIEKLAHKGNPEAINFPRPMLNQKNYDFSFSGLKTSVFYHLRNSGFSVERVADSKKLYPIPYTQKANMAASFQKAAIDVLVAKTMRAAKEYGARSVILCGGVAANKELKRGMRQETSKTGINFVFPETEYNNDNAAMIAAAGYFSSLRKKRLPLEADGDLNI